MSRYSRVVVRGSWILVTTLLSYGVVLVAKILAPVAPKLFARARDKVVRGWGATFCRALGMRVTVRGPRPRGRFLLISNHLSYVDIPLLAAHVDAIFVAKADLGGWPLLGRIFRMAGTIFIDRGRKRDLLRVMDSVSDQLSDGHGVIVFAEGTTGQGDEILPLKPSLFELAAREAEPVYYATISYRTPPGSPTAPNVICWWDATPFITHFVRLLALPGFEASLAFGSEPMIGRDRKALAERLRSAMLENLQVVTGNAAKAPPSFVPSHSSVSGLPGND